MISDGKVTGGFTDRLQAVAGNGTGYLQVQDVTRERRGWVFLEDHDVVAVLVEGYQPSLGRRLTTSGLVSIADMDQVLTVVKDEYDPRIAGECVTRGLVDAATIEVLYREFMLSAASSVNEWDLGTSHWVADVSPWEGRSTPVSVPALVSAMARRKEHWTQLWTDLSAVTIPDRIPVRTSGGGQYSPETPCEAAVLAAVDGKRTVDQVAGECGFTRFQAGHVLSELMAKKVLDLFPVDGGPRLVPDSLPVEAGYYAPSQPLSGEDDTGASAADPEPSVHNGGQHSEWVAPRHSWVVPLVIPVPVPTQPPMDPPSQDPPPAGPLPDTASNPEGNVVTQHVDAEGQEPGSEPEPEGAPDLSVNDQGDQLPPATDPNLGEFFVSAGSSPLSVLTPDRSDGPAPERTTQHPALPPLPAITGGPSDFYVDSPSSRPALTGGVPVAALSGLPTWLASQAPTAEVSTEPPAVELAAEPAPRTNPTNHDNPYSEAVTVEPETAACTASEVGSDVEVAQLREDLLRMASERSAAMDKAILLRGRAVTHSAEAADAASRVEEDGRSISRLNSVTSEASAIALGQLEGLRLAQAEVARVGEIKARVDAEAEAAGNTLMVRQGKFDEASEAQADLERDLQAALDRQEADNDEWTAARDGAARSEANARHADATVTECDQLMNEARERLTALATVHLEG